MQGTLRSMARSSSKPIESPAQMRILASPATLEVLEALQTRGPSSIAELGPAIGRKPNTLHYHIRKLLQNKLIVQVDSKRSGARTEAVYDVVANNLDGAHLMTDERFHQATIDAVASILRLAARNFRSALSAPTRIIHRGKQRNMLARRVKARLTRAQLAEVNALLDQLDDLLQANNASTRGTLHAVTIVVTPLQDTSDL